MQLSREEAVAKIVATTPLSQADIDGLLDCNPEELALIIQSIKDRGVMPSASAWDVVKDILGACVDVADVLLPITGAIAGVYGIAHL